MKLLIFCPYYPPHTGGLESHADEFNNHLSQKVDGITVFTPRIPENSAEKETRFNNVKIVRFPAFEIISNYPLPRFWSLRFWQLFFALFDEKFDIVISRTRFFFTSLLALIYAKVKRTKWIHIEHGSDFVKLSSQTKTFIAKIYDYTFGLLIFKFSDLNISISKAVQKFVHKFDKRNSPIIYRGLDFDKIDEIKPDFETKEAHKNKTIISFVGRLYKWKGVENSIQAIKTLPNHLKEKIVFLIIGDGEDFSHLKEISKDEDCIQMLGSMPREKAIGILKVSDIYLHSAYSGGGLSTSLMEAMYCECAVIATPNEGADEIIKHNENGLLAPKTNEISKVLEDYINNEKQRRTFAKNAQESIRFNFTWDKAIQRYLKLITHSDNINNEKII